MKTLHLVTLLLPIILSGCTHAGPFVTNITTDQHGNLIIEKRMVHYCPFSGPIPIGRISTTRLPATHFIYSKSFIPTPVTNTATNTPANP